MWQTIVSEMRNWVGRWLSIGLVAMLLSSQATTSGHVGLAEAGEMHTNAQVVPELHNDPVETCARNLLADVGRTGPEAGKLPALYRKHSMNKETEFMEYMLSVIYVESRFNKGARSPKDAIGLMQMTLPAVKDAVTHCKLKPVLDMDTLLDSATNVRYGSCYLKKLLGEMDGNWTRALIAYNGGYQQLTRYDRGDTIVNETANYVIQVHRVLDTICRKKDGDTQ